MQIFFTIQDRPDADRLRFAPGEPWPTAPRRAQFGPGVYAWATREEAEAYLAVLLGNGASGLAILSFRLPPAQIERLRQFHLSRLSDPEAEAWLQRHSALWTEPEAPEPHEFEYISRRTQVGIEH